MFRRILLAVLAVVISVESVSAQVSVGGTIRGLAKDEQGGALPGVTVTAQSPTVPGTRTAVTGGDGSYRFLNLPPAVYSVTAELPGFRKSVLAGVEVRAGLNLTVDIKMSLGALTEAVNVSGEVPVLETEKPVQSVNVAGDYQLKLPLSTRHDLTDSLEVTPGVSARSFIANNGIQVYFTRGTDVEQHVVQIDGADMGGSRQGRPDYVNMSTFGVADTQVATSGGDASAPIGFGVIMDITTRSGTDRLKGDVGFDYQGRGWNANNDPQGVPSISDGRSVDAALGGPIKKGRAWFFATYRYVSRNAQVSRSPAQLQRFLSIDPNWKPFDNQSRAHRAFVKASTQLGPRHQLSAFYLRQDSSEQGNQSTNFVPLSSGGVRGIGTSARLYSAWSNALTTTVSAAFNNFDTSDKTLDTCIDRGGPQILLYDSANTSAGRLVGSGLLATRGNNQSCNFLRGTKTTYRADLNWYKTGWAGSHEFQVGVFYQPDLNLKSQANYLNGGFILEEQRLRVRGDLQSGYIPFRRRQVDKSQLNVETARSNATDTAIYLQDAWKVSRLTLTPGLRVDWVTAEDLLFKVKTQSSTEFAPRIGGTWAVTPDARNILHFSASRMIAKPEPAFLPTLGGAVTVTVTDTYDTAGDGSFATSLVTPGTSQLAANRSVDPNRHQPRVDEYLVGFRRQLPAQISFDATVIRRYYRDTPAQVEINGIYDNAVFTGYRDVAQNQIFLLTNTSWNTPVYTAFEVVGSQRTSRSQFVVGYTRQFQHLSGTWQPNDPASFIQPEAFPNNRGIGSIRNGDANSLSGTSMTRNPMWIKHMIRLSGSYNFRKSISVSSNLTYMSGPYTGPIVRILSAPDPKFGPATLRLSNGRTVSNPLATTFRFAYATRGDGQLQSPNLVSWNARVAWTRDLGGSANLDVALNVTNITNRDAQQEFLGGSVTTAASGSNQIGSPSFAYDANGNFQGQNRQPARAAQLTVRLGF